MFLFRCAFWLSVVYASILLTPGKLGGHDRQVSFRSVEDGARQQASGIEGHVVEACRLHPAVCIDQAARLTSLVEALGKSDGRE